MSTSSAGTPKRYQPWVALQHRDFRFLMAGAVAFSFGENGLMVANAYQAYALTGSTVQLGFTGLFQAVPLVVFGFIGGSMADSVERKKLIIVAQLLRLVTVLTLAVLTQTHLVEIWHIYATLFFNTAFSIVDRPARTSMTSGLVPREHLLNALGMQSLVNQSLRLVVPTLVGLCVMFVGIAVTYYVTAFTILLIILAMLPIRVPAQQQRATGNAFSAEMLLGGLRYLVSKKSLLGLYLLDIGVGAFGAYRTMLPVFAEKVGGGPLGYSLLVTGPAIGSMLGSSFVMMLGETNKKAHVVLVSSFIFGLLIFPFAFSEWLLVSFVMTILLGCFDTVGSTSRSTTIQLTTPDHLRGRMASLNNISSRGLSSVGGIELGIVAAIVGPSWSLAIGGVICIFATVAVGLWWQKTNALAEVDAEP